MNWFQAVNHAMTTIATGGFSTEPTSIQHFQSPDNRVDLPSYFMAISVARPSSSSIRMLRGRTKGTMLQPQATKCYWFYVHPRSLAPLLLTLYLVEMTGDLPTAESSIRAASLPGRIHHDDDWLYDHGLRHLVALCQNVTTYFDVNWRLFGLDQRRS